MSRREEFLKRLGHDPANPIDYPQPWRSTPGSPSLPLTRPTSLMTMPPSEYLPDVVQKSAVPVYQVPGPFPADDQTSGTFFETGAGGFEPPAIEIYPQNLNQEWSPANQVVAHEVGHSIWHSSMNPEEQARWTALHRKSSGGPFARYADDPSHSFAEAYGTYVTQPEWLKTHYPQAYDFFKKKLAFEYSRKIGPK